jgi:hypothetical protein
MGMKNTTYTLEDVKILLEMQRKLCAEAWTTLSVRSHLLSDYEKISRAKSPLQK